MFAPTHFVSVVFYSKFVLAYQIAVSPNCKNLDIYKSRSPGIVTYQWKAKTTGPKQIKTYSFYEKIDIAIFRKLQPSGPNEKRMFFRAILNNVKKLFFFFSVLGNSNQNKYSIEHKFLKQFCFTIFFEMRRKHKLRRPT